MSDLDNALENLQRDVEVRSSANAMFADEVWFDVVNDMLSENGDLRQDAIFAPYKNLQDLSGKPRTIRGDGYSFDEEIKSSDNVKEFTLIILDYFSDHEIISLNTQEIERRFRQAERLIQECSHPSFVNEIEETSDGFKLVYSMSTNFQKIDRFRILLATNALFSGRAKELANTEVANKTVSRQLFDLKRYAEIQSATTGFEPISIDANEYGYDGISALQTPSGNEDYEAHLLVIPGEFLARVYDEYGARLLEQNVRTFLQLRGKVNKGMNVTLKERPHMFFAYNNGLTATATSLAFSETNPNKIICFENLQIVNGGQTTASIHYAWLKDKVDLTDVAVQMKLSVVSPEQTGKIVPEISRFANTQNSVNNADFFANHPFHRRFQQLSQKVFSRKPQATFQTGWYYERSRGAYSNETAYKSNKDKRDFTTKFPREQLILKTDLAKSEMSFHGYPHEVAKGAQNAFMKFAEKIGDAEHFTDNTLSQYNEEWFKRAVARVIVFREVDKLILSKKEEWYEGGGTKALTVTYSIAWLAMRLKSLKRQLDLEEIWRLQEVPESLKELFAQITRAVYLKIKADDNLGNVTQYAKRAGCWNLVKELELPINEETVIALSKSSLEEKADLQKAKKYQRQFDSERDWVTLARSTSQAWLVIEKKAKEYNIPFLSEKEQKAIAKATRNPQTLNEIDASHLYKFLRRFEDSGLNLEDYGLSLDR